MFRCSLSRSWSVGLFFESSVHPLATAKNAAIKSTPIPTWIACRVGQSIQGVGLDSGGGGVGELVPASVVGVENGVKGVCAGGVGGAAGVGSDFASLSPVAGGESPAADAVGPIPGVRSSGSHTPPPTRHASVSHVAS